MYIINTIFSFKRNNEILLMQIKEKIALPKEVIVETILPNGLFPGNPHFPLIIYKAAILADFSSKVIKQLLEENHWINAWVDGIYHFHHYHSNTHEALVVIAGDCRVQIGGKGAKIYDVSQGDVIILPAGTSHKNVQSSTNFKCVGAYPFHLDYDMNYGKKEEHPRVDDNIARVGLPQADPIFGKEGLLFKYWHS